MSGINTMAETIGAQPPARPDSPETKPLSRALSLVFILCLSCLLWALLLYGGLMTVHRLSGWAG